MKNWKENLKMSMNDHGLYPKDEWKKQLFVWCKEWCSEVNKLDGLCASLSSEYNGVSIKVNRNGFYTTSFICKMNYFLDEDSQIKFRIQTPKGFDYRSYIMNLPESDERKLQYYIWDMDEISGYEIFQEGFVLQTLNIAFRKYLQRFK